MTRTPSTKQGLFWWTRPRIIDVTASELLGSHSPLPDHRYIALAVHWKGCSIGRAVLEMQGRAAVIRLFHVDAAWRGRGIGRRLWRKLLLRVRFQLVSDIYVRVTVADAGFYALHRFRPVDGQGDTQNLSNLIDMAGLDKDDRGRGMGLLMQRRLTFPFVNVPFDGITVKM